MADPVKTGGTICGGLIILFIICVTTMLDTVEPTEYGLLYNKFSKTVDKENIYEGGRFFVFLFKSFITFPKTKVNIEFSDRPSAISLPLQTRTKDGLALSLHVSF
jgi:hypothetical protein